ncbi:MAG TPA: hypothetical protein VGM91_19105 [Conexibacter sp.]|jgi:hypothetical protein
MLSRSRIVAGEPHHGISLLRIARAVGPHVERRLGALVSYYDAHRRG